MYGSSLSSRAEYKSNLTRNGYHNLHDQGRGSDATCATFFPCVLPTLATHRSHLNHAFPFSAVPQVDLRWDDFQAEDGPGLYGRFCFAATKQISGSSRSAKRVVNLVAKIVRYVDDDVTGAIVQERLAHPSRHHAAGFREQAAGSKQQATSFK
jgi:hypothetical protein